MMFAKDFLNKKINIDNKTIIIILLSISFCFALYFFGPKNSNTFLFVHDGQNFSSINDTYNKSFVLLNYNEGLYKVNTVVPSQYFVNIIFYYPLLLLGMSINFINFLFYFTIQSFIFIFGFLGLLNIFEYLIMENGDIFKVRDLIGVSVVSFFYFFNTFNLLNINSGIFFSFAYFFYGLIPFYLFYLLKLLKNEISNKEIILFSIISFFVVLNMPYVIPILFLSLIILLSSVNFKANNMRNIVKKIFLILVIVFPLLFPVIIPFVLQSVSGSFIKSNLVNATNALISDGFLTFFRNQFSWILYTVWEPRSIYSFYEYINSGLYIITSFSVYIFIIIKFIKDKNIRRNITIFILILLVSIFFAKGSNYPFGEFYSYLVNHFAIFGSVRSPDNKFSVMIPITLSVIFLFILKKDEKTTKNYCINIFYILLISIIFSIPFFTKEAVSSKDNFPKSGSYFFSKPVEYDQFIKLIDKDKDTYSIISFPNYDGGFITVNHENKLFIGRDILASFIQKPFLYFEKSKDGQLNNFYKTGDVSYLKNLNAKYILVRKDLFQEEKESNEIIATIEKNDNIKKIIDNKYLNLYILGSDIYNNKIILDNSSDYNFTDINVVKYKINIANIKNKTNLYFFDGFNSNYKIYLNKVSDASFVSGANKEYYSKKVFFEGEELSYLYKKPIFDDTHKLVYDYANQWTLDPDYIKANFDKSYYKENPDSSIDVELTLYFKPQSYFYLGLIISGTTLLSCMGYLIFIRMQKRKRKKIDSRSSSK